MPRKRDVLLETRRRLQVLEAAKHCFVKRGFHQTTMREILNEAGLSAGAVYNYFPGKTDIVKAIAEDEQQAIQFLVQRLAKSDDPGLALATLIKEIVRGTDAEDAILATEIFSESCRNPEIRALTEENYVSLKRAILVAVQRGQDSGHITLELKPAALTETLVALYEGFIGRIAADAKLKPRTAARQAYAAVLRLLAA